VNSIVMLRFASALVAFALCVSLPGIANAANFAGTWAVSGTLGNPVVATASPVCVFKQDGNEIHGSCKGPNGLGSADGAVDGQKIVFNWHHVATTAVGITGTSSFKGVLESDGVIRGTWTSSAIPNAWGTFTAQRVK
jgi:hypothetical protein